MTNKNAAAQTAGDKNTTGNKRRGPPTVPWDESESIAAGLYGWLAKSDKDDGWRNLKGALGYLKGKAKNRTGPNQFDWQTLETYFRQFEAAGLIEINREGENVTLRAVLLDVGGIAEGDDVEDRFLKQVLRTLAGFRKVAESSERMDYLSGEISALEQLIAQKKAELSDLAKGQDQFKDVEHLRLFSKIFSNLLKQLML